MINSKIGSALVVMLLVFCTPLVLEGGDTSSYDAGTHSSASTGGSTANIMMSSSADVQGFVVCIANDGSVITLDSIDLDGTAGDAEGAEFVVVSIHWGEEYRVQPTDRQAVLDTLREAIERAARGG
mgnify:CR=1 FL=1